MVGTIGLVVGIDAGGTGVRVGVSTVDGDEIARLDGPSSPDGGPDAAILLLRQALENAARHPEDVTSVVAGITKITRAGVRERWLTALEELVPAARIDVIPDYVIGFHGALSGGRGVSLIAGTGSVAYAENGAGESVRVGGRGWEWGDEGSGAHVTSEMIRRTLRSLDQLGPETDLTRAVVGLVGTNDPSLFGQACRDRIDDEGRGFLVRLALDRANGGDTEAKNLFVGAAGWLALLATTAAKRVGFTPDMSLRIALVGGLWNAGSLLRDPFLTVVRRSFPDAAPFLPDGPGSSPLAGAVRLAHSSGLLTLRERGT